MFLVDRLEVDETVGLEDTPEAPTCKLTLDFCYLATGGIETDSIARLINATVQSHVLGKEYASVPSEAVIDSFRMAYIHNYRSSIRDFYLEDLKKGLTKEELPSWYNYTYDLVTNLKEGKKGYFNYVANISEYTGGAHPNSWTLWMNFDKATGKMLTLNDVFLAGSEKAICQLLLKQLIAEMATRLEDNSIQTLKDLQEAGVLNATDMYLSENFLLEENQVSFMYNRYDIAPYAMGAIALSLPYSEVAQYLLITKDIEPSWNLY